MHEFLLSSKKIIKINVNSTQESNIKLKSSNYTYLKIIEIFNKLFKKMNIIKMQKFGSNIDSEKRVILSLWEKLRQ